MNFRNSYRGLGRKFRRSVDSHIQLNELEAALAAAPDIAHCWKIICASSYKFGFSGLRMSVNGAVLEDFRNHAGAKLWQLRIPLPDSQYINFFRDCTSETDPVVLSAFADAVERGLRKSPLWNFTTLVADRTYPNATAVQLDDRTALVS